MRKKSTMDTDLRRVLALRSVGVLTIADIRPF